MYKILLKSKGASRDIYAFYQIEETSTVGGVEVTVKKDYETSDLAELATKYKELLAEYTTDILVPMHVLDVDLTTVITENI